MMYFADNNGEVYAFDNEHDAHVFGPVGLRKMRSDEIEAHLNPSPAPKPVPKTVSRAQGKAALISANIWGNVLAFVESIEDPTQKALAEVALNDTTEWRRDSPFLAAAAAAIGIDDAELDDLFLTASEIVL